MAENQTVKETVFNAEKHDENWPFSDDSKLRDVVAWFTARLAEIPEGYRDVAECEISSKGGHEGDHYASIEISYQRPETASERGERLAKDERDTLARRKRALDEARAVLARYGEKA